MQRILTSFVTVAGKVTPLAWLALGMMIASSLFAAYFSAKNLIINADATISVYMFKDGKAWGDIFLADWHTNILKIPLLFLQAHLPFNMATFIFVNSCLLFATIAGWAWATALVFGKKYFAPTGILLAILLSASQQLPVEVAFTTIRNIEYPFYFLLIILFWRIITRLNAQKPLARKLWLAIALFVVGMTVLQTSDPFFSYASVPALIITLLINAALGRANKRALFVGILLSVAPLIAAKALLAILVHLQAFQYYAGSLVPTVHPFDAVPTQLWTSIHDIIGLYNGDIFGATIGISLGHTYTLLLVAFGSILAYISSWKHIKTLAGQFPAYATMLISSSIIFILYILTTGFEHQVRYLVILLLCMTTAIVVWALKIQHLATMQRIVRYRWWLATLLLAGGTILSIFAYNEYRQIRFYNFDTNKRNMLQIVKILKDHRVNTIVSGHSYVSTVDFWAQGSLDFAPVSYCNQNLPFLTRESWYSTKPHTSANVAMIVDRDGRDAGSWKCSDQSLFEYYGQPIESITVDGVDDKPATIHIYPKTILDKIMIIRQSEGIRPQLAQ